MRARGVLLALVALSSFALHAFDYGLDIMNSSTYVSDGNSLTQQNRATPWISVPLSPLSGLYLSGFYEFKGTFADSGMTVTPWRFDAGRSEYAGTLSAAIGPQSVLRWAVGRTYLADFSGWLVSGLYDGGRIELSLGNNTVAAALAYTGLLNKNDALISIDANDQLIEADSSRYFAPRRLYGSLTGRLVEILPGHDFGLEAWGQYDLEQMQSGTQTAYLEPFVEGRFGRTFSWRAWTAGEMIFSTIMRESLAAGALARVSMPEFYSLRATASVAWSSGAAGGLSDYSPLKLAPVDTLTAFTFSNILTSSLDVVATPLSWVSTTLHAGVLFRSNGSVEDILSVSSAVRSDATSIYLGSEASLFADFRTATDLSLNGTLGVFIPNNDGYFQSGTPLRWTGILYADFSM